MKSEFKSLIRSISSFVMIFSAALVLLLFLLVLTTSILGLNYFSGDVIEVMLFLLLMGMAVIAIAAVINNSLNKDLIAEAKIQELYHVAPSAKLDKRYLKWGMIVLGILFLVSLLRGHQIQRTKIDDFKALTSEVAESHQRNLERIFDYLEDTSQIIKINEVLETVNRSSDQISWTEAIVVNQVLGKESIIAFSAGTDSATLVSQSFENLIVVPPKEEKKLLKELFSIEKSGPHVLLSENNEYLGYYPISKNGKTMVVRLSARPRNNGRER